MSKSLKVNDTVKVIAGGLKGTEAKIVSIDRENGKACLEGVRVVERHFRKSAMRPQGGKKSVHLGIDMSNLKLVKAGEFVKSSVKKVDKKAKKGAK